MLRIHNAILHTVALSLLVAGISAIHKDVRRHIVNIVAGDSMSELTLALAPVEWGASRSRRSMATGPTTRC